jgi:hypothetical protein
MRSSVPLPSSSSSIPLFKSSKPSIDEISPCIDIVCESGMDEKAISAMEKALQKADIKYRIWRPMEGRQLEVVAGSSLEDRLKKPDTGPLSIILLQSINYYSEFVAHSSRFAHKPLSLDGHLCGVLNDNSLLGRRMMSSICGQDPECKFEFVNYCSDKSSIPHTSTIAEHADAIDIQKRRFAYDRDEVKKGKKIQTTFHTIGKKDWKTLAAICKVFVSSEVTSQPTLTLGKKAE